MIQPVDLNDFFSTFFAAAGVILSGASYALLYAFARLHQKPLFRYWAYVAYLVLGMCVWSLVHTAHLDGIWQPIAGLMLVGYFLAPRIVFRLCQATHESHSTTPHPIQTKKEKTP